MFVRSSFTRISRSRWILLALATLMLVGGCAQSEGTVGGGSGAASSAVSAAQATGTAAGTAPTAPAPSTSAPAKPVLGLKPASVIRVVDGDTAVFSMGGRQEKVRFIGVDTPGSTTQHEPYGEEASNYTKRVLGQGRTVYLETDAELRDRYGRMLAYVWLEAPTDRNDASMREKQLNARLLLHGYAQQMTIQPNSRYADFYTVYAREAREQNRGLWALPVTSPSGAAPSKPAAPASGGYVGSRRSNKFHARDCQWGKQIASHNLVVFKTRAAAVRAGYVPCKVCKP